MGTVVFVSGIFDGLHVGHIRFLRAARELGDELVVGVISENLLLNMEVAADADRLEAIRSLRDVDSSFLVTDSVEDSIDRLRPSIVVKGREHRLMENPEAERVAAYGGQLVFTSGSGLDYVRHGTLGAHAPEISSIQSELRNAATERGVATRRLVELVHLMAQLRVLVVGDVIVDEYVSCTPVGMSREDATLVVNPVETERFIGGAAIVAAHARSLCGFASLHSVVGDDDAARFVQHELAEMSVPAILVRDPLRRTTKKQRWMTGNKVQLRINWFDSLPISDEHSEVLEVAISEALRKCDVLILSDFSYGVLTDPLIDRLIPEALTRNVLVAADSQTSSQIGNIGRFVGAHLLTPTEHEARVALRNTTDGLVVLADELRAATGSSAVCLTLAGDGILLRGSESGEGPGRTLRIPALNGQPEDVSGAGDSLLATMSLALRSGASLAEAGLLGSVASAIQVSRLGNKPVGKDALLDVLDT